MNERARTALRCAHRGDCRLQKYETYALTAVESVHKIEECIDLSKILHRREGWSLGFGSFYRPRRGPFPECQRLAAVEHPDANEAFVYMDAAALLRFGLPSRELQNLYLFNNVPAEVAIEVERVTRPHVTSFQTLEVNWQDLTEKGSSN